MVFSPEAEAKIPRRILQKLKRAGLVALLLKGKKKILIPLPLPLPLPLPVIEKLIPEPEPIAYSEPSYSAPQSYGGGNEYGGGAGAGGY